MTDTLNKPVNIKKYGYDEDVSNNGVDDDNDLDEEEKEDVPADEEFEEDEFDDGGSEY